MTSGLLAYSIYRSLSINEESIFPVFKNISTIGCKNISDTANKIKCWDAMMDETLQKQGVQAGFVLVLDLLKTDKAFEPECHTFMHKIGTRAYDDFVSHRDFDFGTESILCSYGFYHGFTETLASGSGNVEEARDFCALVVSKLKDQLSDIEGQCYHGFGHGSVDIHNKTLWGNERAMIAPAIKLCNDVAQNGEQLFRCGTGVFDSISIAYFKHNYKLKMKPNDPFWLCKEQNINELKRACYVSMDPALLLMTDLDFLKAAKYIEAISDDSDAVLTMGSLALPLFWIENERGEQEALRMKTYYKNKGIQECRKLQLRLRLPCLRTVAYALSVDEKDTSQYKEGLNFCKSSDLSKEERSSCLSAVWNSIKVMFPKDKVQTICREEAMPEEKIYCQN